MVTDVAQIEHGYRERPPGLARLRRRPVPGSRVLSGPDQMSPDAEADPFARHIQAIAANGDREAFGIVFAHFAPRIKAYLMRLGGGAQSAEELTQETMALVWRKAGLFDPARASSSAWIFTIARNQRIDSFRRERRPELDAEDPALRLPEEPGADAQLETKQSTAEITRALAGLPPGERQLLTLAYFEDKSHSVIAAELGIPLGTVKSRLRRVFQKLRTDLTALLGPEQ